LIQDLQDGRIHRIFPPAGLNPVHPGNLVNPVEKKPEAPWRIATDTGGTFTDCHALDPVGRESRC
jgi:hypothetical protein